MGSAVTHGDWIWKAGEDFARQVDTSLKTKGKRKASTPRSHPPSCLTPAGPLSSCPAAEHGSGGVTAPEVSPSTERGSPWGHRGSQPSGAGKSRVHTGTCEHRAL